MRAACQPAAHVDNDSVEGGYKPYIHLADHPQTTKECVGRTAYEGLWNWNNNIGVDIVAYGWLKESGDLWKVFDQVRVESPMLMLSEPLYIQRLTFTQDNDQGSLTHLHLVREVTTKAINQGLPGGAPGQAKEGTGK